MQLAYFFEESIPASGRFLLGDESARHIVQVLRMSEGEQLLITDGRGTTVTTILTRATRKMAEVEILERRQESRGGPLRAIAIGLIKNRGRFEWFMEKVTELGLDAVIPLHTRRTERPAFQGGRMRSIAISAMLQSRQSWIPEILEPVTLSAFLSQDHYPERFIAHCGEDPREPLAGRDIHQDAVTLIGPEGDFTEEEISLARAHGYIPVSLGDNRLRTETAGIVAAVLMGSARHRHRE